MTLREGRCPNGWVMSTISLFSVVSLSLHAVLGLSGARGSAELVRLVPANETAWRWTQAAPPQVPPLLSAALQFQLHRDGHSTKPHCAPRADILLPVSHRNVQRFYEPILWQLPHHGESTLSTFQRLWCSIRRTRLRLPRWWYWCTRHHWQWSRRPGDRSWHPTTRDPAHPAGSVVHSPAIPGPGRGWGHL